MKRITMSGQVSFTCQCGETINGSARDAKIGGKVLGKGESLELYQSVINTAAHDRVNHLVYKDCPECGLDYMAQLRLGSEENIVYVCKCGYKSH
jgi:predicted RNA-binding Zn-ribbon protein involved in translation (DUF1610 family)